MKICLGCNTRFNDSGWLCPVCGYVPENQKGYMCFSNNLFDGFEAGYFEDLFSLEDKNFWFSSRSNLILWILKEFFSSADKLLEIGCGTGYVLSSIQREYPDLKLYGSDIFIDGLVFAKQRLNNVELFQMDARNIVFDSEFDIIGAFDVIEHIKEDELVLSEIFKSLNQGGGLIITVPQHPFLWSNTDEIAYHVRRYTAKELRTKVERAGFKVERIISFVSLLFPLLVISRLKNRIKKGKVDPCEEFNISPIFNKVLTDILSLERFFIKKGISFPFGGSLLLVARKA